MKIFFAIIISLLSVSIFGISDNITKIDSLENKLSISTNIEKTNILLNLGKMYLEKEEFEKSGNSYYNALSVLDFSNKEILANIYINIGRLQMKLGNITEGMNFTNMAKGISIELNDSLLFAKSLRNKGLAHFYWDDFKIAINSYKQAFSIKKAQQKDSTFFVSIVSDLAKSYFWKGRGDSGMYYYSMLLDSSKYIPDNIMMSMYNTLGHYYHGSKISNDSSEYYYKKALEIAKKTDNVYMQGWLYVSLGRFIDNDYVNYNQKLEYLNRSLILANKNDIPYLQAKIYSEKYKIFLKIGDKTKAFKELQSYIEVNDSVLYYKIEKEKFNNYSIYKTNNLIHILEKEKLKKESWIKMLWVSLFFLVIILIIVTIFIILIKKQFKVKRKLYKKELNTISKYISDKNEILLTVGVKIKEALQLSNSSNVISQKLNEANKLIKENINREKDWESFKKQFEQIHPGYFQKLKKEFPDLTQNDIRLIAYVRYRYTNKDISNLLNIEITSVKTARNRLKKKLNLSAENKLLDFLRKY